jgi:hypothetical protein
MNSTAKKTISFIALGAFLASSLVHKRAGAGDWTEINGTQILKASPGKTLIAVDFHEVLAQFNTGYKFRDGNGNAHFGLSGKLVQYSLVLLLSSLASGFAAATGSVTLSKSLLVGPALLTTALTTVAFLSMYKMVGKKERLEQAYGAGLLSYLKPEMMQLASMYTPVEKVFEQIKKLKDTGYTIVLASNIGPESLEIIKKRYPKHFEIFDDYFIPCDETNWVSKKQPEKYFGNLLARAQDTYGKEEILFIDDSRKNCENAKIFGGNKIDSIQYYHIKNNLSLQLQERGAFDQVKA